MPRIDFNDPVGKRIVANVVAFAFRQISIFRSAKSQPIPDEVKGTNMCATYSNDSERELDEVLTLLVEAKMKQGWTPEGLIFLEYADFLYRSAVEAVTRGAPGGNGAVSNPAVRNRGADIQTLCNLCRRALAKVKQGEARLAPSPIS